MITLQRNLTFFKKFFIQPAKNASIWPTSNDSSALLCGSIDWKKVHTVLELGPGTGPVTQHIFQSMPQGASYYGIEYEVDFIELLQERFSTQQGVFIQGNVNDLLLLMDTNHIPVPDVVISTLPNSVFEKYPHLVSVLTFWTSQGTIFRAITYAPDIFLDVYKQLQPKVLGHTWKNIPPLYVLGVN